MSKLPPGLFYVRGYYSGGRMVQCWMHGSQDSVILCMEGANPIPVCPLCLATDAGDINPAIKLLELEDKGTITCSFCDGDPEQNCRDCGALVCATHDPCPDCKLPEIPRLTGSDKKLREMLTDLRSGMVR